MHSPMGGVLPGLYAKHAAVTLADLGLILIISRVFDAITDPLIGIASDRIETRFGSRKPWVFSGLLLGAIGFYFLMLPTESTGKLYFFFWSLVLYLAWTMIDIPVRAWSTELTHHYDERSRVAGFFALLSYSGNMLFSLAPLLLFPILGSTEFTPESIRFIGIFALVAFPIIAVVNLFSAPEGQRIERRKRSSAAGPRATIRAMRKNKPLLIFIGFLGAMMLGNGIFVSGLFLHQDAYLGIGPYIPVTGLVFSLTILVALPIWKLLIERHGRIKPTLIGWGFNILALLCFALITPGPYAHWYVGFLIICAGLGGGGLLIAPMAMLADIADYHRLKTGASEPGLFFAVLAFLTKLLAALGAGIGFLLLDFVGFSAKDVSSDSAILGMKLSLFVLPTILSLVGATLFFMSPIDKRRQNIIRKRIESQALTLESEE